MKVSASLLSSDLLNLEDEINILASAGIDALHIDIMDGHFVPNIAFGIDIVKRISEVSDLPITVHLMIDNPERFLDVISYANVEYLIVHSEGNRNFENLIEKIREKGIGIGLAINPQTQISDVREYINLVDLALVMGVHPGFGGQTLIPSTLEKIEQLRQVRKDLVVAIDGGINGDTISLINGKIPDILVIGSFLFEKKKENRLENLQKKLQILKSYSSAEF